MSEILLPNEDKFAILSIVNASSDLPHDWRGQLPDGTRVLTNLPDELNDPHWEQIMGTFSWGMFKESNLIFIRSVTGMKSGLDAEHEELAGHLWWFFRCLQISGVVDSEKTYLLKGSLFTGKPLVQQISELPLFYRTKGYIPPPVSLSRLEEAVQFAMIRREIFETGKFGRFLRGLDRLMDGLKQWTGEDRIHQYVRALEALVLPEKGNTKKQFKHRCQTFAKASQECSAVLDEAYEMRNDVEHLHHWHRALQSYEEADRQNLALLRTWQIERLAKFAYSRILNDKGVREYFRDEEMQRKFWKMPDHARIKIWGKQEILMMHKQTH